MTKNRLLSFLCAPILVVCFVLSFAFSNLGGTLAFFNFGNRYVSRAEEQLDGVRVYGDEGYVSVSELFNVNASNEADRKFSAQNLKSLLSLVLGEEYTGIDQLKDAGPRTSKEMAESTYGKEAQALPIQVRFADLYWDVVYLSEDVNGDPILTLWLSGGGQYNWKTTTNRTYGENSVPLTYDAGTYFGFQDGSLYSIWSATSSGTEDYPANMYSTSYIRTMTLNSGGQFITSSGLDEELYKRQSNVFYRYTMPRNSRQVATYTVNRFLVQPKDVSWQISGQSAKEILGLDYDLPNENCTSDEESSFASGVDYTEKNNYYAWAEDYLWLPSLSEVGIDDSHPGLWQVPTSQKKNSSAYSTQIKNLLYGYNGTWLRSGVGETGKTNKSYFINYDGNGVSYEGSRSNTLSSEQTNVAFYYAVRPAIHLNLTKAIKDAGLDRVEINIDGSSLSDYMFNANNVHAVYDILGGKKNTTYKEISELAKSTLTSEDIMSNTYNKNAGQYLTIWMGGFAWDVVYLSTNKDGEPILTLWLNSSKNFDSVYGPSGSYSNRNSSYRTYMSKWSSDWGDSGGGTLNYPSNMYGTSYIRAVPLNNGGSYADGGSKNYSAGEVTLTNYNKKTDDIFANFTTVSTQMVKIANYLEQPKNIPWQIFGQSTLPNEYCASGAGSGLSLDYTGKDKYYAWAEDYLWLPSLSETGYDASHTGIWKTSVSQRYNHLGFDGKIDGNAETYYNSGEYESYYIYDGTLLRSGDENDSSKVYHLNASGNGAATDKVYEYYALRPALHLNLKKVATEMNDLIQLTNRNILLTQSSEVYTGAPITVDLTYQRSSVNNKVKLTENVDYTIVYGDNVNAGQATCTITGINGYTGVVETWFRIGEYTLKENDIELIPPENLVYTGDPITAAGVKIKSLNRTLKPDEDYEIEYGDNISSGYVGCTIKGKGNYKGTVEDKGRNKFYFEIEQKELTKDMIQVVEEDHFVDVDVRIQFSLVYNGKTLEEGTDYTFKYSENNRVTKSAKLTITAAESRWCNFKGSFTYEFEIKDPNAVPEPEPEPDPTPGPSDSENTDSKPKASVNAAAIIIPIAIVLACGIAVATVFIIKKKKKK